MANYLSKDVDELIVGDVMPRENQNDEPSDGHGGLWRSGYEADKAEYDRIGKKKRMRVQAKEEKKSAQLNVAPLVSLNFIHLFAHFIQ